MGQPSARDTPVGEQGPAVMERLARHPCHRGQDMDALSERRGHRRTVPGQPTPGLARAAAPSSSASTSWDTGALPSFYVNVLDVSEGGARIESLYGVDRVSRLFIRAAGEAEGPWRGFQVRLAWSRRDSELDLWLAGLELTPLNDPGGPACGVAGDDPIPMPEDVAFLLQTSLLGSIPERASFHLLNCLRPRALNAGERLFSRGQEGDSLYLIQRGRCSVKLEKDGGVAHLACLQAGEVVGEMAVLTGEPRSAHVDAETDLKLWRLGSRDFHALSGRFPDLRFIMTELVTQRFEHETSTGDRHIGRYIIKNKLGKGGWSIVYQGVHQVLNAPVAIKMLKHNMATEEGFLRRFRNEAQVIARLNHRNIVRVYDIEARFQTLFIVMEYLEGQPLDGLLERLGRVPYPRALGLLGQICEGLAYAHDRGIIHQDVKPANLFVQADDRVKILDFGLACQPGSEDLNLAGTIFYAAPEQIEGLPMDARTDLYALGITAYEILTGNRPFPEEDLSELVRLHLDRDVPDPRAVVPELPESVCRFVLKCCRRDAEERYQSIGEALQDLRPLIGQWCPSHEGTAPEKLKAMNVLFLYRDEQQLTVNRLLEELGARLQELGLVMKATVYEDL